MGLTRLLLVKYTQVSNDICHILLLDGGIYPLEPGMTVYMEGQTAVEPFVFPPQGSHVDTSRSNDFGVEVQTKGQLEWVIAKFNCKIVDTISTGNRQVLLAEIMDVLIR